MPRAKKTDAVKKITASRKPRTIVKKNPDVKLEEISKPRDIPQIIQALADGQAAPNLQGKIVVDVSKPRKVGNLIAYSVKCTDGCTYDFITTKYVK